MLGVVSLCLVDDNCRLLVVGCDEITKLFRDGGKCNLLCYVSRLHRSFHVDITLPRTLKILPTNLKDFEPVPTSTTRERRRKAGYDLTISRTEQAFQGIDKNSLLWESDNRSHGHKRTTHYVKVQPANE